MDHKKANRKANDVRKKDMKHMAEDTTDSNATKWFKQPAYQVNGLSDKVRCLIRAQGSQIERRVN